MAWDLQETGNYYKKQGAPRDQSALLSLLREVQEEYGGIPKGLLPEIGDILGVKENFLLALIRRIPSLRLADRHVIELCAGPNCGKHTKLLDLAQQLAKASGGKIEVKTVPCMRLCGKGPNVKWDGVLHHGATEDMLRRWMEKKS